MKTPFLKALPILDQIEAAGFEAYFVGGSVRDFLLDREIDDVDIATSATPEEIKEIFPKTIDVGIEHGTVVVLHQGNTYEVTTFRSESDYDDFRRPNEVTFIRSLEEDLRRRDFTMNAIAMTKDGTLIDPFFGQDAIRQMVIKTVGDAGERFHEDALRMMRAVRFVSQLSFTIDEDTYGALKSNRQLLQHIAVERITTEFEKLLLGRNYHSAFSILLDTGIYQHLPGFSNKNEELNSFLQKQLDNSFVIEDFWVILLYYLELELAEVEIFLRSWKQPIKKMRRVKKGLLWLSNRLQHEWTLVDLYNAKSDVVISTEKLYNVIKGLDVNTNINDLKSQLEKLPIKERSQLDISGQDLMDWYQLKGGPWIEEKLLKTERAVICGEIQNRKEAIREWLFRCNQR
jgi:tRNA nucleotidyltransferase (CCA-adding enzyme)